MNMHFGPGRDAGDTIWRRCLWLEGEMMCSRPTETSVIAGDILVSLGEPFLTFWTAHMVTGYGYENAQYAGGMRAVIPPPVVPLESMLAFPSCPLKRLRLSEEVLPSGIVAELFRAGYECDETGKNFILKRPEDWEAFERDEPDIPPSRKFHRLPEPDLKIPDRHDPAVYNPHVGHGAHPSPANLRSHEEAEGLDDALSAISYLSRYVRLIEEPNAVNLFHATEMPWLSDSYSNTMRCCFADGISDRFITLLHSAFHVHWIIRHGTLNFPLVFEKCPPRDRAVFEALINRYCEDNGVGEI